MFLDLSRLDWPARTSVLTTTSQAMRFRGAVSASSRAETTDYAEASDFRAKTLSQAKIRFEDYGFSTPEHISQLIAMLTHWPRRTEQQHEASATTLTLPIPRDEEIELQRAADLAEKVNKETILDFVMHPKPNWFSEINTVLLGPLRSAAWPHLGQLSLCQRDAWTQTTSQVDCLPNPAPDFAIGLARELDQDSPLSEEGLQLLDDSGIELAYSALDENFFIYPAFIHEARCPSGSLFHAENQLAVSAARALAMLNELSSLSRMPFQHCVVLAAAQGSMWQLYVAYQEVGASRRIVSIFAVNCT